MENAPQQRGTGRRRLWVALAVMIAVACVGSIGTALATENGMDQPSVVAVSSPGSQPTVVTSSGDMSQNVAEVATAMALDGHEYPLVVARVNGEAISSKILAQRVYAVQQAGPGAPEVADPVKTALDALIQEMILRHAARARGIKVSDAEIQAFERQQQLSLAQSPEAMSDLRQIAAAEGDESLDAYWSDPRTIAFVHDVILLGKMRLQIARKLAETLLTPQPNLPENQQQAIDQFVAAQHAHVEIYINP